MFRGQACGMPAEQIHHVVYQQHVRRNGGSVRDSRNFMLLCHDCHRRHHNRVAPIPRSSLPAAAVEFAVELLGEDYADDYLARRYA